LCHPGRGGFAPTSAAPETSARPQGSHRTYCPDNQEERKISERKAAKGGLSLSKNLNTVKILTISGIFIAKE
jgi:membrane carboxypeptidase/penicillin-binding protein